MQFSIVTAVRNRAKEIPLAMKSLTAQTFKDYEHIVQDGASTDGTVDVVAELADARTILESAPDKGIYDAINKGIERSSGDIIGLLHSDDFNADETVLQSVKDLFDETQADAVYSDLDYVLRADTDRIVRHWKSGSYAPAKLSGGWMPPHPTLFVRRHVIEHYGTYDTSFKIAADYDAMLRYLKVDGIQLAYLPRVTVKMRVGGESNRSLSRILTKTGEDYRALKKNGVGGVATVVQKNLSKVSQFWAHK